MRLIKSKLMIGTLVTGGLLSILTPAVSAKENSSAALDLARQLNQAFIEVADKVSPSVVVVKVALKSPHSWMDDEENPLWEMVPKEWRKRYEDRRARPRANQEPIFDGQGSGIIIRKEGYILTNRHVVDGASKIRVRLKDGREFDAEVKGMDAQSDIAVIRLLDKSLKDLPEAKLADSSLVRVGEFAIAIGAPFDLDYSVTFGHVSAKGRTHVIPDPAMDQDFIQTDANINPGNSGGPLVNINSEVIGINTLINGLHTGIGFAIPSSLAKEVADQLISDGKFTRSWLGISIAALREDVEYRKLVTGITDGVIVKEIMPDGPAAKSELKPSDIITSVDGHAVATPQQLKNEIRSKKVGSDVALKVYRKDKLIDVKVQPEAWPDDSETKLAARGNPRGESALNKTMGLTVQTLTKELNKKYGTEVTEGVIVTDVVVGSPAESKGIRIGDVITEVDRKPTVNVKDFREAMKAADSKKGVIINLNSQGTGKFVVLKDSGQ
ncbi:MAG: trypsin-like peptidase domain-containing protein [Verrucomicrobiota bacterium]